MLAGRFKDRVVIQKRTQQRTATGVKSTWETVGERWGSVVLASVEARARYQQLLNEEITHTIYCRGGLDISLGDHRFIWRGRVLTPIAPLEDRGRTASIAVREEGYGDS